MLNDRITITALLVILSGFGLIYGDTYHWHTEANVWVGVGCSLLASAFVILLNNFLVNPKKESPLDKWGIDKIYKTRAEKNLESDPELDNASFRVDAIAFGLKTFRTQQHSRVEKCLENGVNFRIISMHPETPFVRQREIEEEEQEGQIKKTIVDLISWANTLNRKNYRGKIEVKGYSCMTLDFYWRVDNNLYIGPYWYHLGSQQTITYKYKHSGIAFNLYTEYFERLWNSPELITLTSNISPSKKRARQGRR